MRRRNTHTIRIKKQEKKQASIIFNKVRQFAYVLETRERDFIDLTINYKLFIDDFRGILGILDIQSIRALTLIYSQRVSGF